VTSVDNSVAVHHARAAHEHGGHTHTHEHGGHVHVEETTGPSLGPVVLDIGGDFGAAVVRTPQRLDGTEIEIRRLPSEWDGTHVAVRLRPAPGSPVYAAVFGHLLEGAYELRRRHAPEDPTVHRIDVVGGGVVDTTWPDSDRRA
jgi:hypothetical protein